MCTYHTLMVKQLVLFGRLFNWTPRLRHAWRVPLMKSQSVKTHVRSRINEGPPAPTPGQPFLHKWMRNGLSPQMNVKLISPKYKWFPSPSSILSPESDGWIFHVPRDRPTGRGGCSCQVLADPGRPELAHDGHQVDQANPPMPPSCSSLSRFRLACRGRDSSTAYLPVTVFIQDINDNPPIFQSKGFISTSIKHFSICSYLSVHATSIVELLLKQFLFSFFFLDFMLRSFRQSNWGCLLSLC